MTGEKLAQIAKTLKGKGEAPVVSTRQFLSWFGAQRRGYVVVWKIRKALKDAGLVTSPDFEAAYIDALITFELVGTSKKKPSAAEVDAQPKEPEGPITPEEELVRQDPTYRVSKLAAANRGVVSVAPDSTIEQVVTIMLERDFSQVPVMTGERDVKGIITWGSIGSKIALSSKEPTARSYMEKAYEVRHSDSMFDVIQTIVSRDCVLVRADDNKISGIITASDLSVQFRQLSEPFLLLSEIENLLRIMIERRFAVEELKGCVDEADTERQVSGVADLTFGEYIRLLENPERWARFGVAIDRTIFCKGLDDVRRIRNDVMHFDPDGVPQSDLDRLRDYTRFLSRLQTLVA